MAELTHQEVIIRLDEMCYRKGLSYEAGIINAASNMLKSIPKPKPKLTEYGPWTGWNGGECPVDHDTLVDVVINNNGSYSCLFACAARWEWRVGVDNIIAYRVHKPEPKTVVETWWMAGDDVGCLWYTEEEARRANTIKVTGQCPDVIPVAISYEVKE